MRIPVIIALTVWATAGAAGPSEMIAELGLQATENQLTSQPAATGSDHMAIGAVRFLRGIEKTLQTRWQHNASIDDFAMPILGLPFEPNPNPKPFEASLIAGLFEDLNRDMKASREALAQVGDDNDAALVLNLRDVWFDVNMNGTREDGEDLMVIGANTLLPRRGASDDTGMPVSLEIGFDRADVDWLIAYTELFSGLSEFVIAFDPTEPIETVIKAHEKMAAIMGDTPPGNAMDYQFGNWVDLFAMVYGSLNKQPDAPHRAAARDHGLALIDANRRFWSRVALETDNDREWIPNDNQTAALGFTLPPGTGQSWLAVLEDGEKVLNGELLVSFWRIAPAGGVNVKRLFEDPPAVDIVGWVQGWGLVDYMERGPTIDTSNLRRFEALVSGNTALMAFLLN